MDTTSFVLASDLLLKKDTNNFLDYKRVLLLENITIYGSISKAAKKSNITYKTAWNWIDKMNSLSTKPIVQKISGGVGGGGTIVTAYAKELIKTFEEVQALNIKHLETLENSFKKFSQDNTNEKSFSFSSLNAKISKILETKDNAEVLLTLACGSEVFAKVKSSFIHINDLKVNSVVSLLIESDSVSISLLTKDKISSRNKLEVEVKDIIIDGEDVVLKLLLCKDEMISSRITYKSYKNLNIKKGDKVLAIFKAYSVTLFCGSKR